MSQPAHDKKQYLYEDIRGCIKEGLSIKETADLCGCRVETVRNWTKDIRDVKKRHSRITEFVSNQIKRDYLSGMKINEIAEKYGYKPCSISTMITRKGWTKGADKMRGGVISSSIDIQMLNAEAEMKKTETVEEPAVEEKVVPIVQVKEDHVCEKTVQEESKPQEVKVVEEPKDDKKKSVSSIFRNLTACFDGRSARYTIRFNNKVRIMIGGIDFEIPISELDAMACEFQEISKRFGGLE